MKLSNFAFSPISNPLRPLPLWKLAGTNKAWMAPDIYELSEAILPMNIFSLGLVFAYFLSGGLHPFALEKEERIVNIKKRQPIIMTVNHLLNVTRSTELLNLISLMLSFDWAQRPTTSEILSHPFLSKQSVSVDTPLRTESSLLNVVQSPSRNGQNSSLFSVPHLTSANQVAEDSLNNANSTSQLQDSTLNASFSRRSSQSYSSSTSESSASCSGQQDQERTR